MLLIIYNIVIYLIQPLIWIRLLWNSRKLPAYRHRWAERYGFCRKKIQPGGIILHSVSVGETLAAIPLVHALQRSYPMLPIIITTMTPTGSKIVQSFLNKNIYHVYLPYDLPGSINRFLKHVCPKLVIIMETELWPNLIKSLYILKVPIIIANARLSIQSTSGYEKISDFISSILRCITLVAAQHEEDGENFLKLGLKKNQLSIIGNLKFEIFVTQQLKKKY